MPKARNQGESVDCPFLFLHCALAVHFICGLQFSSENILGSWGSTCLLFPCKLSFSSVWSPSLEEVDLLLLTIQPSSQKFVFPFFVPCCSVFFCFPVQVFKPRVLCMPGNLSTTELHTQLGVYVYEGIGLVCLVTWLFHFGISWFLAIWLLYVLVTFLSLCVFLVEFIELL